VPKKALRNNSEKKAGAGLAATGQYFGAYQKDINTLYTRADHPRYSRRSVRLRNKKARNGIAVFRAVLSVYQGAIHTRSESSLLPSDVLCAFRT